MSTVVSQPVNQCNLVLLQFGLTVERTVSRWMHGWVDEMEGEEEKVRAFGQHYNRHLD